MMTPSPTFNRCLLCGALLTAVATTTAIALDQPLTFIAGLLAGATLAAINLIVGARLLARAVLPTPNERPPNLPNLALRFLAKLGLFVAALFLLVKGLHVEALPLFLGLSSFFAPLMFAPLLVHVVPSAPGENVPPSNRSDGPPSASAPRPHNSNCNEADPS